MTELLTAVLSSPAALSPFSCLTAASIKQWDAKTSEPMSKVILRCVGYVPVNNTHTHTPPSTTFQEAVLLPGPVRLAQKTSGWCKLSLLQHTLLMSCLWLTADPRRGALEQTLHHLFTSTCTPTVLYSSTSPPLAWMHSVSVCAGKLVCFMTGWSITALAQRVPVDSCVRHNHVLGWVKDLGFLELGHIKFS